MTQAVGSFDDTPAAAGHPGDFSSIDAAMSPRQPGRRPPGRRGFVPDDAAKPMPPGLAARLAAAAGMAEIAAGRAALDDRFAEGTAGSTPLEPRDRALARSIATVSFRRLGTLRAALARFLEKGLPRKAEALEWTLICGAAQILFLDVPDHAAVDLAVHAARHQTATQPFAALANAVLRKIAQHRDEILAEADPAVDTPPWLWARWTRIYGEDTARAIAAMHRLEPTLDLSFRSDREAGEAAASLDGVLLPTGSLRLRGHDPVPDLDGFSEGRWWVQDVAAALPARLIAAKPGESVADLCAAPGGKTATLAATGADVTAVDRSAERLKRLAANMERLGLTVDVRVGDILSFSGGPFDAILLDAPCTATGTIRRHPDVAWTKRPGDVAALAATQTKMLDRALTLLKPGGRLVYGVCSLEPEEGDAQIAALLRRNPDVARLPVTADEIGGLGECLTEAGDIRTLPTHLPNAEARLAGMDGFFAARLRRHG